MNELEEIRNKKGLSYKALSKMCGISACTISNYEKGKIERPQAAVIEKVMKALNSAPNVIKENAEIRVKVKCLNENCLLNTNKECGSPVLGEDRFTCQGKQKVKIKEKKISNWRKSTKK